mmetsp:Transcript_29620/g.47703  ORF Transcript_29620/g.47703 Transcript_29620/m.47703 type:complete len:527 (+) Transcript_29620:94-1674(+)|eukprot:CAMPEP_0169097736 /NCGR_PEP_ID=MMETSP1015-20121227/19672_1 /TAXON_ID=342587 /ORGANISM="Karlodinium micrum, Strain CCMP2283" /LENGTH=526 /DNA_ID=CAMNT_0009158549 /DNA_START=88 /DNA_END=1668 /DNA_ORIENTATION=+
MIMDTCFSEVGRSTDQHLNNLRRQLGTGVDPAFDYSSMLEMQKKLAQAGKKTTKERADRQHGETTSGPASGLDLLKRTLREVVGVGAGVEDEEEEQVAGNQRRARSTPADIREQRDQNRNSYAFMAVSRDDLKKLDVENRFRAPPIGSYRPKEFQMSNRTRQPCHQWAPLVKTKSLKAIAIEKEIERRKEEGKPYDDLVKHGVSIEMEEGIPGKPKPRQPTRAFEKDLPRPDMTKAANIQYNDNSFTAGLVDGDLYTSKFRSNPCFDFAKLSTAPAKEREYYFQPGQYAVKLDSSKPRPQQRNIAFDKQQNRKPLSDSAPAGLHLPDRSLSRPGCFEGRVRGFDMKDFTNRKPIYDKRAPDYDSSDPRIEESVLRGLNSFDAFEAIKPTRPGLKHVESFKNSLTRLQHARTMRSYADDKCLQLARTNLTRGPTSSEMLPMDSMHDKPSLIKKVVVQDLRTMQGREVSKEYRELPPRGKDLRNVMFFERETRSGDARRPDPAFHITELPASRSYDALPRQLHPSQDS